MREKAKIMDENAMWRAITRISYEIVERNQGAPVIIIGILRRGAALARRIAAKLEEFEGQAVQVDALDITPYRDDTSAPPPPVSESLQVQDKRVILVDDVIYTGRSARAAIDAVMRSGRPKCIQLAVLIDRGHREVPIRPDYVGKNLPTASSEIVRVLVEEYDGINGAAIYTDGNAGGKETGT